MKHEVLLAGSGGQGIMSMGMLLAYAGMLEGRNVSWIPSYGPQMRGGDANCAVVICDVPVASPLVEEATGLIVMNQPSLERYERQLRPQGVLVLNASLISTQPRRSDLRVLAIPANELAEELGEPRVANMIILGGFLAATRAVSSESVLESLRRVLPPRRHHLLDLNRQALERGESLGGGVSR
ncbi:MAG: 2-oxoacid:acceptor oxidoreductase family protein [Thermaerobacter sp.]|nr:2-oxoacid:acceptor oxidoreductase family protein [Thermaerobacter sp.]